MKNKGFTLIELLAVILILGVIALIAIPAVNSVIKQAKVGANKSTGDGYVKAAQSKCQMSLIGGKSIAGTYHISEFEDEVTGTKDVTGKLTIDNNCRVELVMEANDENCYVKSFNDDNVSYYQNEDNLACMTQKPTRTEDSCFEYIEENNEITITGYKCGGLVTNVEGPIMVEPTLGKVEILEYTDGTEMNPVIPAYINGKSVTKIGDYAFSNLSYSPEGVEELDLSKTIAIESVSIPSTVKEIGAGAFLTNAIKKVNFSEGLQKIGISAFASNKIEGELFIPNTVTDIGAAGFFNNNIEFISFGSGLYSLREYVFRDNNINSLNIPSTLLYFGYTSLADNKLTGTIEIPSTVLRVGSGAFRKNDINKVVLTGSDLQLDGGAFYIDKRNDSNIHLSSVVNKTGKVYDWGNVLYSWTSDSNPAIFEIGTISNYDLYGITTVVTK